MCSFFSIGPDDVPRLRDEHSFLERQLKEVLRLATASHRKECEVSWEIFARDSEQHMRYEENLLFRPFAKLGVQEQQRVDAFLAEHEEFRSICRAVESEFAQPAVILGLLHELAEKLMVHKEREALVLYPWLGSLAPPRLAWESLRLIVEPVDKR